MNPDRKTVESIKGWLTSYNSIMNGTYIAWPGFYERTCRSCGLSDSAVARLTGWDRKTVSKLKYRPSEKRELMIAIKGIFDIFSEEKIDDDMYYDMYARMTKPSPNQFEDFTCLYVNSVFADLLAGNSSRILINPNPDSTKPDYTMKYCVDEIRKRIFAYYSDFDLYDNWVHYYQKAIDTLNITNQKMAVLTGLDQRGNKKQIKDWRHAVPENADALFMIAAVLGFSPEKTWEFFLKYCKDDSHPDFTDQNDCAWMYLIEHITDFEYLDDDVRSKLFPKKDPGKNYAVLDYFEAVSEYRFTVLPHSVPDSVRKKSDSSAVTKLAGPTVLKSYTKNFIVIDGDDPFLSAVNAQTHSNQANTVIYDRPADRKKNLDRYFVKEKLSAGAKKAMNLWEVYIKGDEGTRLKKGRDFLNTWMTGSTLLQQISSSFPGYAAPEENTDTAASHKISYIVSSVNQLMNYHNELFISKKESKKRNRSADDKNDNIHRVYTNIAFPDRKDLIFYGIILNLPSEGISRLLQCYGYTKLDVQDPTEYFVHYAYTSLIDRMYFDKLHPINTEKIPLFENEAYQKKYDWYYKKRWYSSDIRETEVYMTESDDEWSIRKFVYSMMVLAGFDEENWLYNRLYDEGGKIVPEAAAALMEIKHEEFK